MYIISLLYNMYMLREFISSLSHWNTTTTERQKLQHSYLVIAVIAILTAGLVSLVSAKQGHTVARIALFAIGSFLANAVVWNLLNSALISKLPTKQKKNR